MPKAYTAVADKVEGPKEAVMSCVVEPYPVRFARLFRITWVSWKIDFPFFLFAHMLLTGAGAFGRVV